MSYQIITQPDGQYALWDTIVDAFILIDATPDEITTYLIGHEASRIRIEVERVVASLKQGGKPYHQFTKTWEQALRDYRQAHFHSFDLEKARRESESEES